MLRFALKSLSRYELACKTIGRCSTRKIGVTPHVRYCDDQRACARCLSR